MLHAQGGDKLLVHGLVAVLCEDAEQGLPLVQSLGSLPQPSGETVGNQSLTAQDNYIILSEIFSALRKIDG